MMNKIESQPIFEKLPAEADGEVAESPVPTGTEEQPVKKKRGPPKGYKFKKREPVAEVAAEPVVKARRGRRPGSKNKKKSSLTVELKPGRKLGRPRKLGAVAPLVAAAQKKVAALQAELDDAMAVLAQVEQLAPALNSLMS